MLLRRSLHPRPASVPRGATGAGGAGAGSFRCLHQPWTMTALIELDRVSVHFDQRRGLFGRRRVLRAVDQVSLSIEEGETLGLVGESGSGKSTLGHVVAGLLQPTLGSMRFRGRSFDRATRTLAQHAIQIV